MSPDPIRRELGGFLRAVREHTAPADVGLSPGARRRTPGLRREEVATLSGVSIAWYTWLEQGRVTVSRQVLDSVCGVLRMDARARRHALELAGFHGETAPSAGLDDLRRLIDAWPTTPALLLDQRLDITGWNSAYRDVVLDPSSVASERRNLLLLLVGELRDAIADWPRLVRGMYGQFRSGTDRLPDDPRVGDIRRLLAAERPDLAHWWQCRSVSDFAPTTLKIRGVSMTLSLLRPVASADAFVLTHTPADGSARTRLVAGADSTSRSSM
ncbi:helix-turn-helix transcriptional regulator [Actinoallomurus sp. NPDC052308]|uniref:helix-turn-helix domain-containing protein n=1 Tax=Actinoallomurus sp. NPDC052308 TaxID=3155530 RepID=UPI00343F1B0C